jgi:thiosulfate reductase cytochrome b subunit
MSGKIYLYPAVIRVWHLMNAVLIICMIITGISLQYSDPNIPFINFAVAVEVHNTAGILLSISYLIFIIGNIVSGNIRHYRLQFKGLINRNITQFKYYTLGLFKGEQPPFPVSVTNKFNPLQYTAYFAIMFVFVPLVIITGLGLLFPGVVPTRFLGIGGIFLTAIIHVIAGFFISIFLFVHLYFCTIGSSPLSNFKSIITGYHDTEGH